MGKVQIFSSHNYTAADLEARVNAAVEETPGSSIHMLPKGRITRVGGIEHVVNGYDLVVVSPAEKAAAAYPENLSPLEQRYFSCLREGPATVKELAKLHESRLTNPGRMVLGRIDTMRGKLAGTPYSIVRTGKGTYMLMTSEK